MNLFISLLLISLSVFAPKDSLQDINDALLSGQEEIFNEDVPPFSNCPASPYPTIINQPNNTTITIIGKGNMVNHWTETTDGYTIVLNNGIYEYANKLNGELVPSGVLAHDPIDRNAAENSFVNTLPKSTKPALSPLNQSILNQVRNRLMSKTFPTTGNIRVLALLIDYPNLQNTFSASTFDSLLYASNYRSGDGSFKYFYETASDSLLTIQVDVRGWYRAANNYLYYSRDSGYARAADLVREAVDAAEVAGVNFANYDNDNDNRVDGILAVHSGPGAEQGSRTQYIWSHRWVLNGGNLGSVTYDGKLINDYMVNPETRISGANQNLVGIGVFCHEFGHNLGLPDLYDTDDSNGDSEGIGNWCLMAGGTWLGGEHRPSNFSAWCRVENNWANPSNLTIGNSSSHTMQPSVNNQNEIYRINTAVPNEYFLLENRQKQGLDVELPGEGLAVWHINTNKTNAPGNSVNADETLKGVDLEEADGNNDLDNEVNRGDGGDLFPGSSNTRSFDDSSSPDAKTYTNANTGLQLRNITENGSTVSFDFGPPAPASCSGSSTLTAASGTFDDGSGNAAPYASNLNCSWLIQPTNGPINLSFNRFDLDSGGDTLYLYDGANSSAALIGKYTGAVNPPAAITTGNSLFLEFITDGLPVASGWEVSYTSSAPASSCSGNTNLSGLSGTFDDGSGPGVNYPNNLNCSWQIDGSLSTLLLQIDSLDIESTNDSLIIYEGQNNSGPVAATITDNSQATTLALNSRYAFVEFKTNATVNADGWQISWIGKNGCSGTDTLRSPAGTFTDGTLPNLNYNSFSTCQWLIEPAGARLIALDFNRFNLERNFDFVEVYAGPTTASPRIARLTGNSIPSTIVANGSSMLVRFTSDLSINFTGFEATYNSQTTHCLPTQTLTTNSGSFSDGSGITANYDPNLNCGWVIQPQRADTIKIDFTAFDTESTNDVVNIYNGTDNTGTLVASYSGNTLPPQTVLDGTQISAFVEFVTNATVNNAGWDLSYNSSRRLSCTGPDTLTASSGTLNDGSGSFSYDNNLNCSWLIQPSGNPAVITLDFNSLNVPFPDVVRVYDGTDNTGILLATRSGNFTGNTLSAFSGAMYLEFVTNGTTRGQGWSASYNSSASFCLANTTLTANAGSIIDGSPSTINYLPNTDCQWLIQPTATNVAVRLTFNRLNTELNNDTITIYDGGSTSDPILGTVSGSSIPSTPFISSGGTMLLTFKTNATVNLSGFTAFYQTQLIPFCSGQTNLTAVSGTFDDGSPANSNYVDNSNCSWLIQPLGASLINLQFNRFAIFPGDTVNVYDGNTTSAPKIGSFSGFNVPSALNSSGGALLVTFNSNPFSNSTGWEASYNSSTSQCFASSTLTNARDTIRDGSGSSNYGNNLNCSWLIQPATATSITLNFLQFDLDNPSDSLLIYDGPNNSSAVLAAYTGSTLPSSVSSTGGDMFVEFVTDGSNTAQGWEAYYDITSSLSCVGTTTFTAPNGSFDDGSGPSANYDNNLNCSWLIQPTGNPATISLNFTSVSTASFNDRVTVYDGTNNSGTILGTVFLNNVAGTLTAFSGSMYLEFTTDGFGTAAGWDATYSTTNSFCAANSTLTAPNGFIDDGSPFSSSYLNNTSCQWLISPAVTNQAIRFNFSRISTEFGIDTVTFYDGTTTNDPIIGSFSGNAIPNAILSSGPNMLITFISNASVTGLGWRGNYQTVAIPNCTGQTNLTAASGTFDDGSGPSSNYSDNTNCSWLIQPPGAITIDLSFNSFSTEAGFDFLRVYDGTDNSGTLLGTFSGLNVPLPPNLQATSGAMFLEFISDISITAAGWEVSYTSSNTANLSANPDTITINAALGSQNTFSVSSNASWVTSDNSSWMLANPINGNGNQNVTVVAIQPNIGPIRYGEVYVNDQNNTAADTVVVEQLSSGRFLVANPDTLFFQASPGGSQTANLQTNVNWSLSSTFPWITIGTASGSNNGSSQISVTSNTGAQRIGYVVASGNLGVSDDTIFVNQAPAGLQLSVSPSTITLAQAMGSNDVFNITSNVSWQTSTPASWLSIQNPQVTSANNTVGITATSMNSGQNSRSSYVAVQDVAANVFDTVFVTQLGGNLVLTANPDNVTLGQNAFSTASSALTANVNWTATVNDPVNFDVNPKSGTTNDNLVIEALTTNNFVNPRNSFIVLDGGSGAIQDTIFISQMGQPITLSANPKVVNLNQATNSVDSFKVFSNTGWNASSPASWVSPNISSFPQFGDTTIILNSNSANTGGPTRTTFIALEDILGVEFDTVIINQTGTNPILEANQDTVFLDGPMGSTANITFLSNGVWTAIQGATWFSTNLNTNSGNGNLSLTANSTNNGSSPRVSYMALADIGQMLTDTVIVIQDTVSQSLNASPDTVILASNSGAMGIINLNSSISWSAAPAAAWFNLGQSNGMGNAQINVISNSANSNFTDRFSEVVFTDLSDPLNTDTVIIQQEGTPLQLSVSPLAINLNSTLGSNDILNVTSNTNWTVNNPVSWLSLSANSGNGNSAVTVTATSDNLSGSIRLANLTFSAAGSPDVIVSVQQIDGTSPSFIFSRDTVFVDFIQGSTGTFSVLGNQVSWSLSENTPWLLVNPASGNNTTNITVLAASRNAFGNPRYGTIIGSATGFNNDTIVVAQRSSTPLFQAAPSMLSLGSDSANTVFFNISSNLLSWKVEESMSWMEVSPDTGAFTQRIEVAATETNNSGALRSGMIQIVSPPQVPLTVIVSQDTVRSIGLNENSLDVSLNIYPNPTRDRVIIEGAGIDRIELDQIQIYNANGRLVNTNYVRRSATQIEIDLSTEAAGIYYLRYLHNEGSLSKKIILMD